MSEKIPFKHFPDVENPVSALWTILWVSIIMVSAFAYSLLPKQYKPPTAPYPNRIPVAG